MCWQTAKCPLQVFVAGVCEWAASVGQALCDQVRQLWPSCQGHAGLLQGGRENGEECLDRYRRFEYNKVVKIGVTGWLSV